MRAGVLALVPFAALAAACQSPSSSPPPAPPEPPPAAVREIDTRVREIDAGWEAHEESLQRLANTLERFMERVERLEGAFRQKHAARGKAEKDPEEKAPRLKAETIDAMIRSARAHLEELEAMRRKVAAEEDERARREAEKKEGR